MANGAIQLGRLPYLVTYRSLNKQQRYRKKHKLDIL